MQHTPVSVVLWPRMLWLMLMSCTFEYFVLGSRDSCLPWPWCCLYAYPTSICYLLWRLRTCWILLRLDFGCVDRSRHWRFCASRPAVTPHTSQDEMPSATPSPIVQGPPGPAVESNCPRRCLLGNRTSEPLTWWPLARSLNKRKEELLAEHCPHWHSR